MLNLAKHAPTTILAHSQTLGRAAQFLALKTSAKQEALQLYQTKKDLKKGSSQHQACG